MTIAIATVCVALPNMLNPNKRGRTPDDDSSPFFSKENEGTGVGAIVGDADGDCDGSEEGYTDGRNDGLFDGTKEGVAEGIADGEAVGNGSET